MADLTQIEKALDSALDQARGALEDSESENLSTNDAIFGQHLRNTNKEGYELDPCSERAKGESGSLRHPEAKPGTVDHVDREISLPSGLDDKPLPKIPLGRILALCREFATYAERPVRHWHDLVRIADVVWPMMGISPSAWDEAKRHMGPEEAAVVILAMLERSRISGPMGGTCAPCPPRPLPESFRAAR